MKRVGCVALLLGAIFACGDARNTFESNDGFDKDGGVSQNCDGVRCSRDRHAIVDGCDETNVIETCAPDQGCENARCIPACDVASSSTGCEFAAVSPAPEWSSAGSCFAAFLTNTWETPARVEADYDGKPLDVVESGRIVRAEGGEVSYEPFSGELQPGEVAVLFLSAMYVPNRDMAILCPAGVKPALQTTARNGTYRGSAVRLKTTAPVSAYSIYPFGGAESHVPSSTMLLPLSSWKTGYVITSPAEAMMRGNFPSYAATQIVAAEDDTDVIVLGSQHIQAGDDVEGAARGVPHTYRLRRGEQLQFEQERVLTGTRISANKKIGVWSSHECMDLPVGHCCCDSSHLQLFPVSSMGREYAVVPYFARAGEEVGEDYQFRITGAVDGTELTYEPERPEGAPEILAGGESVPFVSRRPFIVRSQDPDHPIGVYAFMTGPIDGSGTGDPEFTTVVPTEQYLDHYIFFIDPTYRESQLLVVRSREQDRDFQPVALDCAGPLEGWQPLGTSGKHEYTRVRLTKDFEPQTFPGGKCGPGRHVLDSPGAVGVTVWGVDNWSSYAYPGGAANRSLNNIDPVVVR